MKNKDRIDHLEQHIEVLLTRVAILEMKLFPKVPASAPPEWPSWKPFWTDGPNPLSTQITCRDKYEGEVKFPNKPAYPTGTPCFGH